MKRHFRVRDGFDPQYRHATSPDSQLTVLPSHYPICSLFGQITSSTHQQICTGSCAIFHIFLQSAWLRGNCAEMRECMEMLFASMIETCFAGGGQPLSPPNHQSHPSVNRSFHQPTHPLIIQPISSRRIRESTSSGKRDTTAAEIRSSRACKLSRLSL